MPQIDQIDHEFTDAPDVPLIAEGKTTFNSKASGWLSYWKTTILPEITAFISKLQAVITGINAASADIDTKHAEVVSSTAIVQALANGSYDPNYTGSGTVAPETVVLAADILWYTHSGSSNPPAAGVDDWIAMAYTQTYISTLVTYIEQNIHTFNYALNPHMDVWQEGNTTWTADNSTKYVADVYFVTGNSGSTATKGTFPGTDKNAIVITHTTATSSSIRQFFDSDIAKKFKGKKFTVSTLFQRGSIASATLSISTFGAVDNPSTTTRYFTTATISADGLLTITLDSNDYENFENGFYITISTASSNDTIYMTDFALTLTDRYVSPIVKTYSEALEEITTYVWQGYAHGKGYGFLYGLAGGFAQLTTNMSFSRPMRKTPAMSIVTQPTYDACTHVDIVATPHGFAHRVYPTSTGQYRAINGVYKADCRFSF